MDHETAVTDVVSHGGDDDIGARSIGRRLIGLVVVLAVIVGGAAYAVDGWQRHREVDELFNGVITGQQAVRTAEVQVESMVKYG